MIKLLIHVPLLSLDDSLLNLIQPFTIYPQFLNVENGGKFKKLTWLRKVVRKCFCGANTQSKTKALHMKGHEMLCQKMVSDVLCIIVQAT